MNRTVQLALAGLSAIAVGYGFARYGFGLFVPLFREEFGLSTREIGLVSSAGYAAYFSAMILSGFLTGRMGPRVPVVTGALCASVGMLVIATAKDTAALVLGVVLAGSSPGFCWAPFSDAVAMLVDEAHRNRVLSMISSGTAFGLMVAGPVVLMTSSGNVAGGSTWRYAWGAFALIALLVAFWNARILPPVPYSSVSSGGGTDRGAEEDVKHVAPGWFLCRRSVPLLGQAAVYGLIAAFYYTYAVDLVGRSGLGESWGPILWSLVGLGGLTGVLAGDAVSRFGLIRCLIVCEGGLALSILALSFGGGSGFFVAGCALLFGASYMPIAAFLVLWSGNVFYERPSTGFSAVLFALALGSIAGPTVLGVVAHVFDLRTAFWCAALLTALSATLRPHRDIHRKASETSLDARTDTP